MQEIFPHFGKNFRVYHLEPRRIVRAGKPCQVIFLSIEFWRILMRARGEKPCQVVFLSSGILFSKVRTLSFMRIRRIRLRQVKNLSSGIFFSNMRIACNSIAQKTRGRFNSPGLIFAVYVKPFLFPFRGFWRFLFHSCRFPFFNPHFSRLNSRKARLNFPGVCHQ